MRFSPRSLFPFVALLVGATVPACVCSKRGDDVPDASTTPDPQGSRSLRRPPIVFTPGRVVIPRLLDGGFPGIVKPADSTHD